MMPLRNIKYGLIFQIYQSALKLGANYIFYAAKLQKKSDIYKYIAVFIHFSSNSPQIRRAPLLLMFNAHLFIRSLPNSLFYLSSVGGQSVEIISQYPPLSGPTRRRMPADRNFAIAFATARREISNLSAIS